LSHRDIEDLLAEREITVNRKAIRLWYPKHSLRSWGRLCIKFGALYARRLNRKHRGYGDTFYIDEVFVKINGKQHYLWRAVDQDGEVVDVYLQAQRFLNAHAAVSNLFNLGRHLIRAEHYRDLRVSAFADWNRAVA
jgi:putative transposase